ncbi:GNAT family N-acetyltransferase [Asticcacaulis sp. AC402]|uniref:GNAT family N-acetyltransferase n=1 Tax=Asticcacaulis sp. AC402 TaxID=1282361 RepID=UPI0003C40C15|nr:GNAT family N-acetyltransferase [Asticcacaulis sp. AC402]ESQ77576.1 hypothetical protein ABAC402_00170 [Asticcacaulis sp. AC402]
MHPLNNPVWHALTSRHAHLAQGRAPVLRYPPEVSPFAALETSDAVERLGEVIPGGGNALIWADAVLEAPDGLERLVAFPVLQLIAEDFRPTAVTIETRQLTPQDVPAILTLTELTRPGPFGPRTIEKGYFAGTFDDGRLVAMAGERMCLPGFTEITAICTHPDYQGQGLARQMMAVIGRRIVAEGRTPFLHSLPDNAAAIRVYESAGFKPRKMWQVNLFGRAGASTDSDGYFKNK